MSDERKVPDHLIDLFAIADRSTTSELFKIAGPVAAGATATACLTEAPPWLRALFPSVGSGDQDRFALLLTWSMFVQYTATTRELARKWRIAKTLGSSDADCIDFALAAGAEIAEQKFAAWALDLPVGATGGNVTDRFMSALAQRVAHAVHAHMTAGDPPAVEDF
jgi:hypothetical protein